MKVSFVCPNVFSNDGIGNNILLRARYFKRKKAEIMVFVEEHGVACEEIQTLATVTRIRVQDLLLFDNNLVPQVIRKNNRFLDYLLENIKTSPSRLFSPRIMTNEFLLRRIHDKETLERGIAFMKSSDIVFFDYGAYSDIMELIRLPLNGKKVFWYHGVTSPQLFDQKSDRAFVKWGIEKVVLARHADILVAHSNYTNEELLRCGKVKGKDVHIIPLPPFIDKSQLGAEGIQARRKYVTSKFNLTGCKVLLYVGRISRHKRIDFLVIGLREIKSMVPNSKLLVVGDYHPTPYYVEMKRLRKIIQRLGVRNDVIFAGRLSQENLLGCYDLCDIYVTASLHEGFCAPIIEAMRFGKPAVGTNCAAIPETIGDAGLTFEQNDVNGFAKQVCDLLSSSDMYDVYASRAIERSMKFTPGRYFSELGKILQIQETSTRIDSLV